MPPKNGCLSDRNLRLTASEMTPLLLDKKNQLVVATAKLSRESNGFSTIGFRPKEHKALQSLGASNVFDFLRLDLDRIFDIPGYGMTTYTNLKKRQDWLRNLPLSIADDNDAICSSPLQEDIQSLGLSVGGIQILRRLKVRTVQDFLALKVEEFDSVRGCKNLIRRHILATQEYVKKRISVLSPNSVIAAALADWFQRDENAIEHAKRPASPHSWKELPLFSSRRILGVSAADLHASYYPDRPVSQLVITKRQKQLLAELKILTIGDLLLTLPVELFGPNKFGERTIEKIQANVEEFLRNPPKASSVKPPIESTSDVKPDLETPDAFWLSLTKPITDDDRQLQVLLERLGWRSKPCTLEHLGRKLGLTRERVRQIEERCLKKLFHRGEMGYLKPLHDLILKILSETSPIVDVESICKQIQQKYEWDRAFHAETIIKCLPAFSDLKLIDNRYICQSGFPCPDCSVLPSILYKALSNLPLDSLDISSVANQFNTIFQASEDCQHCNQHPPKSSHDLLQIAIARLLTLKDNKTTESAGQDAAQSRNHAITFSTPSGDEKPAISLGRPSDGLSWKNAQAIARLLKSEFAKSADEKCTNRMERKKPRLHGNRVVPLTIDAILREHPGPMTSQEVHARMKELLHKKIAISSVRNALDRFAMNGRDILRWACGDTYQHKCHITFNAPIFDKIEKWIEKRLLAGPFPKISTFAAFRAFNEECLVAGLTSEYAIYSCLKFRHNSAFAFHHSPFISLAGSPPENTSNANIEQIIQEYIRQKGGKISRESLKIYVCGKMGLKPGQFRPIIDKLKNAMRMENDFFFID